MLDNAAEFLLRAGEKAGDILESNQPNIEGVAKTNKARTFDRRIDVENSGEKGRLIADDADRTAIQTRKTHD